MAIDLYVVIVLGAGPRPKKDSDKFCEQTSWNLSEDIWGHYVSLR